MIAAELDNPFWFLMRNRRVVIATVITVGKRDKGLIRLSTKSAPETFMQASGS